MYNHFLDLTIPGPIVSKAQLDAIAATLAPDAGWWNNPHKSMFGVGNYDVNVLMVALQEHGYETRYLDTREPSHWIHDLEQPEAIGLICNVAGNWTRHWIAIKFQGSKYYNVDSKLSSPFEFASSAALVDYLTALLTTDPKTTLLLVVPTT